MTMLVFRGRCSILPLLHSDPEYLKNGNFLQPFFKVKLWSKLQKMSQILFLDTPGDVSKLILKKKILSKMEFFRFFLAKYCPKSVQKINCSRPNPHPHYSKSKIFVQKFNFDKTPTFSRVNFFFDKYNREKKVVKNKKDQKQKIFTSFKKKKKKKKWTIYSGKQSWIFGQKMKISNSVLS